MRKVPLAEATRSDAGAGMDMTELDALLGRLQSCRAEIARVIVGQEDVINDLLIALVCGGHILLEGSPGVGKTMLVHTLGVASGLTTRRVQFTPDLMPADVTGAVTLVPGSGGNEVAFQRGPIFTQILLADEINRATPKTQSALLEAMQERTVTAGGETMELPRPFFVLATENPFEMEGTYQLPEAQIDRFLFKTIVNFPSVPDIVSILERTTGSSVPVPKTVLATADILRLQELVRAVPVATHVLNAVARVVAATQPDSPDSPEQVRRFLRFGVSPRGAQSWLLAAKGRALMERRFNVSFADLEAVLMSAMRHRVQINYEGRAEGVSADYLIMDLFKRETGREA